MGRAADPKLAALWQKRVERQLRSGLSVQEYCRREGVSTASFYAWKRRLPVSHARAERSVRRRVSKGRPRPGGFVQVPMVSNWVEVCFADGTTVRVPAAHLATTLKSLTICQSEGALDD
jgi:transposase-like protein